MAMTQPATPDQTAIHREAHEEIARVLTPGVTQEDIVKQYDEWGNYDEHMAAIAFRGPRVVAEAVPEYLQDNKEISILDVGAGRGALAIHLKELGYLNVDAIDPSEGMLEAAKEKKLYRNYIKAFFTDQVDCIETSTYDVLVSTGAMVEGHLKCSCLLEMVRCVKPGGLVVFSLYEGSLTKVADYKDRLEPAMKHLEETGQWSRLERSVIPTYYDDVIGLRFVFLVTKPAS